MPRSARVVYPDVPHHVTQRGSQRMPVFLKDADYAYYRSLLRTFSTRAETRVLAWCLMPNHVHLLLLPRTEDGLRATLAPLHRTYATEINRREEWSGHLWQDRFASVPLDDQHTVAAARYIELNPVRAGLVRRPEEYRWSSCIAHTKQVPDEVTDLEWDWGFIGDWGAFLSEGMETEYDAELKQRQSSCLPLGSKEFVDRLSRVHGSEIRIRGRGRPKKQ